MELADKKNPAQDKDIERVNSHQEYIYVSKPEQTSGANIILSHMITQVYLHQFT